MTTTIYTTDAQRVYSASVEHDPFAALPPWSTPTPPPATSGDEVAQLSGSAWVVLPSYPDLPAAPAPDILTLVVREAQERLDTFAQTRNFDGILSACSYANSSIPKFAAEGRCAAEARDLTWAALYVVLAEVQAGSRPMPQGLADIEHLLPSLEWPT